jgi:methionyl aminopeptidase
LSPDILACLREAGRVAAAAREEGARLIVEGARLRDVCEAVEGEIRKRGAGVAFPAQTSVNAVAAHYCSSPEDETRYADGDLAKLDIGVHVDGWVVDTAVSVNVGDLPANRPLLDAARAALGAALALVGPDVEVHRLSATIEATIASFGLRPMRNLCGHGVARWTVHSPPPIPNVRGDSGDRLREGMVVAIEPFATDGLGFVVEEGVAEVFRLDPEREAAAVAAAADAPVVDAMRAFRGLPFARRQLGEFPRARVEDTLAILAACGALRGYAPLVEAGGRRVAQAEHTVYVGAGGAEVLTGS